MKPRLSISEMSTPWRSASASAFFVAFCSPGGGFGASSAAGSWSSAASSSADSAMRAMVLPSSTSTPSA